MWLGDPVQYKYYDELVKLGQCLQLDYAEYKQQRGDGLVNVVNISKPNVTGTDVSVDNFMPYSGHTAIQAIHPTDMTLDLTNVWQRTVEQGRKCPGAFSMHINYVKPWNRINIHTDDFIWKMFERGIGRTLNGFFVSYALDVPEPENQTLMFDNVHHSWKDGEFVAFNGRHTEHAVYNKSDHHRITAVLVVEQANNWNLGE
jgi:hypothetical protein